MWLIRTLATTTTGTLLMVVMKATGEESAAAAQSQSRDNHGFSVLVSTKVLLKTIVYCCKM